MKKQILVLGVIIIFLVTIISPNICGIGHCIKINTQKVEIESATKAAEFKLVQLGKLDCYTIADSKMICNDEALLFYLFDLDPQGFIIVSTNYCLPPVFAYSFTNSFEYCNSDIPFKIIKEVVQLRIDNIPNLSSEIIKIRNSQWSKLLNGEVENIINRDFQQWPPEGTTRSGGWLETEWDQDPPYNNFCPMDKGTGERSIAGCPAVAMAQILNYHETINDVVFDDSDDYYHEYGVNKFWIDDDHESYDFPSFPELNNYLDDLVDHYKNDIPLTDDDKASLNFACGVAAKQVYSSEVSGTWGMSQAYDAYIRFNCNNVELLDENDPDLYDRLKQNMKDSHPAHIGIVDSSWTTGHNMVVDGYNTDDYYHINFGWGGYYDGWYLIPEDMPYDLTTTEGVVVDIMYEDAGPDLDCTWSVNWSSAKPGEVINGSFTVKNIGDPGSELYWEVKEWPNWGIWSFTSENGDDLSPEDEPVTVDFTFKAPNWKIKKYEGYIKIVNKNHPGDRCYIPAGLKISFFPSIYSIFLDLLEKYPNIFPILRKIINV